MIDVVVKRVVDGDTLDANVTVEIEEFNVFVSSVVRIRLLGVDAPEMKGATLAAARRSRDWLKLKVEGKQIFVEPHGRDKYGRLLAVVYIVENVNPEAVGFSRCNVNEQLIAEGYAIPYILG